VYCTYLIVRHFNILEYAGVALIRVKAVQGSSLTARWMSPFEELVRIVLHDRELEIHWRTRIIAISLRAKSSGNQCGFFGK